MATTFAIDVVHEEARYARRAAAAAFAELDELESRLSRFVEGSDVWRISRLKRGEQIVVAQETFACLATALAVQARTGGAFDVTYASAPPCPAGGRLELSRAGCRVRVLADGVRVDLGGIGKGFALDAMAAVLREWDVTAALLSASTSTRLALDPPAREPGWGVRLGPHHDPRHLALARGAVSGSGVGVKGRHIVDPRAAARAPRRVQAWALAPTAAEADALSTALMLMSREEIEDYCRRDRRVGAYLLDAPLAALVVAAAESPRRHPEHTCHPERTCQPEHTCHPERSEGSRRNRGSSLRSE